jgi:hypothetical protein
LIGLLIQNGNATGGFYNTRNVGVTVGINNGFNNAQNIGINNGCNNDQSAADFGEFNNECNNDQRGYMLWHLLGTAVVDKPLAR